MTSKRTLLEFLDAVPDNASIYIDGSDLIYEGDGTFAWIQIGDKSCDRKIADRREP